VTGLLLALLVLFVLSGVAGHYSDRLRKHGPHALLARWLFAHQNWSGKAITNRGWTRPGTKALTPTGHAHRRWYLPQWQHALWRIRNTLVTLLLAADLLFRFRRTAEYLTVTAAAGAALGAWRARSWAIGYSHRKNYVKPLHARLAAKAGIPVANRPESWIDIPPDLSHAVLTWPKGAVLPEPHERQAIEAAVASTIGMRGAKPSWQFTGPRASLRLVPPVAPPSRVFLDSLEWGAPRHPVLPDDVILQAIREAGVDELVLGIGHDGTVVKVSLSNDSPHIVLSIDSGGGKSVTVRCLASQVLFRGGIAAILDNKLVSHPSLRGLPNVAYADDIEKIHDFLCWLDGEITRRGRFIRAHTDIYGNLTGSPGPRLVVFLEEQNLMMNRLRAYWAERIAEDKALPKDMRENLPAVSPAVRGFEAASYAGRELKVHLCFVAQRFTAEAAGGGAKGASVRMNAGIRLLAGYDDDTWKMLVGKSEPMPVSSKHPGRLQVFVKGREGITAVQVVFFTHKETRQFAESGTARVPARLRHLTELAVSETVDPMPETVMTGGGDGSAVVVTPLAGLPAPVRNWMTIRQAKEHGLIPHTWKNPSGAFGTLKARAKKEGRIVPEVKGMKGTAAMYDAVDLADFLERETATERQAA
jgi:hypothetical protein